MRQHAQAASSVAEDNTDGLKASQLISMHAAVEKPDRHAGSTEHVCRVQSCMGTAPLISMHAAVEKPDRHAGSTEHVCRVQSCMGALFPFCLGRNPVERHSSPSWPERLEFSVTDGEEDREGSGWIGAESSGVVAGTCEGGGEVADNEAGTAGGSGAATEGEKDRDGSAWGGAVADGEAGTAGGSGAATEGEEDRDGSAWGGAVADGEAGTAGGSVAVTEGEEDRDGLARGGAEDSCLSVGLSAGLNGGGGGAVADDVAEIAAAPLVSWSAGSAR
eukprot:1153744-Pelagomonas_calceolata.AAC.2